MAARSFVFAAELMVIFYVPTVYPLIIVVTIIEVVLERLKIGIGFSVSP